MEIRGVFSSVAIRNGKIIFTPVAGRGVSFIQNKTEVPSNSRLLFLRGAEIPAVLLNGVSFSSLRVGERRSR